MTYRRCSSIAVTLLLLMSWGCDNKSSDQHGDAGADATQQTDNDKPDESSSKDTATAKKRDTGQSEPARPTAKADESGTITEKPPLEIGQLLNRQDVADLAGGGTFEKAPLPGMEASPSYNAHRLKPKDGDGYGAGLQVWAFEDESTAAQRINELKTQYLNVEPAPKEAKTLGSSAFLSTRSGIKSLVYQTSNPSTRVIAISCAEEICKKPKDLMTLADKVGKRLKTPEQGKK